jgi:competence protein CoiA
MKFALVSDLRVEASPKAVGTCHGCGMPTVAKCGQMVLWHWAHKAGMHCDRWWEPETVWHRAWKDRFPLDWQEVVIENPATGERHIADVRTPSGLVIEMQRWTIDPGEVDAREAFYQKIVWVVDGTKNESDPFNFSNMRSGRDEDGVVAFRWYGRSKLFHRWHSQKPIFIDFGKEHGFWRILRFDPSTNTGTAGLVNITGFVEIASSGTTDFSSAGGPASR